MATRIRDSDARASSDGMTHRVDSPIFIHGILPRSGTNFLWDLLLLHPDCARGREPVNEDGFLEHSDHLVEFVKTVRSSWDPIWGTFGADLPDRLCEALGYGLVSFLWTDRSRRLVAKSPNTRNLDRFFAFFPHARLLILVRDGRSVVQSAMDTFGWSFDRACRDWSEGARTILRFQQAESARVEHWHVVRYEDLIDDPETQLRSIFEFLDLDPARYDFEAARNLPVRGSSAFGRKSGKVHWTAVAKDASFDPKERWRSWSAGQLARFEWLAGEELAEWGYTASARTFSIAERVLHTFRDWYFFGNARLIGRVKGRCARMVATLRSRGAPATG
jgi:protein-tyrosine sulfotransferase